MNLPVIPQIIITTDKDIITNKNEPIITKSVSFYVENNSIDYRFITLNLNSPEDPPNYSNINSSTRREEIDNTNPCNQDKAKANILSEASCIDMPTGMIKIEQFKNGTSPFSTSIDKGISFNKDVNFNNLQSGKYSVFIKDKFGCLSDEYNIEIGTKNCTKVKNEFAFSPILNETFKFPIENGDEGEIQILTRNGQLVLTANISEFQEWNGESNTGFGIEAGVYVF